MTLSVGSDPPRAGARPVVLAATSGTGKTTIARALVNENDDFVFSISATTRDPRPGEEDGIDYHFVDEPTFRRMIEAGEMAEWAEVHGRLYGTPRAELDRAVAAGIHSVLDIDVQGAAQIRLAVEDALLLFVLPPSAEAMMNRLGLRGTEDREQIARRLRSALEELARVGEFDGVVVNAELDPTIDEIRRIARGLVAPTPPSREADRVAQLRADLADVLTSHFT